METTILLLSSEPVARVVMREVLERAGYVVMATGDLGKPPENVSVEKLAAWTVVANVLLNLDETITNG